VLNSKDIIASPNPLQVLDSDVRHWEMFICVINKNRDQKELYILTVIFKCISEQNKLDKEYLELFTPGQMIIDPIYGHIMCSWCHSDVLKLKL
jgi:hypothetical protein